MPKRGKKKAKKSAATTGKKGPATRHDQTPANGQPSTNAGKSESYSTEQLLTKADELSARLEFELALRFCQRAMEQDQTSVAALERAGKLYLEIEQPVESQKCFAQACILEPDTGHSKYMYLGQLARGLQAVDYFRKGVTLMEQVLLKDESSSNGAKGNTDGATKRDVSNGYLSIAELFMTDLCDEDNAQSACDENITQAIDADHDNPAAHQLKAEYLLVLQKKEEARAVIEHSVSLWWPKLQLKYKEMAANFSADDDAENGSSREKAEGTGTGDPSSNGVPGAGSASGTEGEKGQEAGPEEDINGIDMELQMKCAQILTEVGSHQLASDILGLLLQWNDDSTQIWYMLGLNNYLRDDPEYHGEAQYYLCMALKTAKKSGGLDNEDIAGMCAHCEEILTEMGCDLENLEQPEDESADMETEEKTLDENYETSSDEDEPMGS